MMVTCEIFWLEQTLRGKQRLEQIALVIAVQPMICLPRAYFAHFLCTRRKTWHSNEFRVRQSVNFLFFSPLLWTGKCARANTVKTKLIIDGPIWLMNVGRPFQLAA